MSMRVIIIGAGMAGLSAGIHLRNNGYETLILEAHSIPGGLVSAWKRGRYNFDGCVHWIPGCTKKSPFYPINDEVLNMSGLNLVRHETIMDIECLHNSDSAGDRFFHLYANIDQLEDYMIRISPDDAAVIEEFTGLARTVERYSIPPSVKPAQLMTFIEKLKMIKYLPLLSQIKKMARYSITGFAARFTSPFLKEAFERLSLGRDYPIVILIMQVAFGHQRSSAYPLGGSEALVKSAESNYLRLGGEIRYSSRVERILVKDGRAQGVKIKNGEEITADIVISAADGHWTLFEALEGKFLNQDIQDLYAEKKLELFESNVYVSLGMKRRFEGMPHQQVFTFDQPKLLCDGSSHSYLVAHVVNYDPGFAPEGCTVINVMLSTWKDAFWTDLRNNDREAYRKAKEQARDFVVDILEDKIGGIRENIEEWDVATPATFIRYTSNWRGSIQGWMPSKDFLAAKPLQKELTGVSNFYMIGQWIEPGGGITPAIKTGRDAAWIICERDGKKFSTAKV